MTVVDVTSLLLKNRMQSSLPKKTEDSPEEKYREYLRGQEELFRGADEARQDKIWSQEVRNRDPGLFKKVKVRHSWSPEVLQLACVRVCCPPLIRKWLVRKVQEVGVVAHVIPATTTTPKLYKVIFTGDGGIKKIRILPGESLFFLSQEGGARILQWSENPLSSGANSKRA